MKNGIFFYKIKKNISFTLKYRRIPKKFSTYLILSISLVTFITSNNYAQVKETDSNSKIKEDTLSASVLKRLSLEELMNFEVISVSKRPEKISETASAIQVITSEDIRRYGITRLPEALRLISGMEVSQIVSNQWAISARGFNNGISNKLLVLNDGRSIYSPLFAGVFWDLQDILIEDIDRIEVISGPGAALWGANAVNGIINIVTKSAKNTKGFLFTGGIGNELRGFGNFRYGGSVSSNINYRVYAKYTLRNNMVKPNGQDTTNDWRMGQGGFRIDWQESDNDLFTLQGDIYESRNQLTDTSDVLTDGGNIISRWSHVFSENSDLKLQIYFDRIHRNYPGSYNDRINTFDVDFQHHLSLGVRNDLVWGLGYRLVEDNWLPGDLFLIPQHVSLQTFSAFFHDEISLILNRLSLTLGSKFEHNDYTDFEFQPSVRLAWKLNEQQFVWTAISRAIRTPSRLDRDLVIQPIILGSPNIDSEKLIAYEFGYRVQPLENLSISLAGFYNVYDDLRSIEQVNPPDPIPVVFGNGLKGKVYGAELTADYFLTNWWKFKIGISELQIKIDSKPGSTDNSRGTNETADPKHYFYIRSSIDLTENLGLSAFFRYTSRIDNPLVGVPGYNELDLRFAWQLTSVIKFEIVGQNLLHNHHPEFGEPNNRLEVQRSVFGKMSLSF